MKNLFKHIPVLLLATLVISCDKDSQDDPDGKSKETLTTEKPEMITKKEMIAKKAAHHKFKEAEGVYRFISSKEEVDSWYGSLSEGADNWFTDIIDGLNGSDGLTAVPILVTIVASDLPNSDLIIRIQDEERGNFFCTLFTDIRVDLKKKLIVGKRTHFGASVDLAKLTVSTDVNRVHNIVTDEGGLLKEIHLADLGESKPTIRMQFSKLTLVFDKISFDEVNKDCKDIINASKGRNTGTSQNLEKQLNPPTPSPSPTPSTTPEDVTPEDTTPPDTTLPEDITDGDDGDDG